MSFGSNPHPDPDDYFSDTRMSFGDHLEDLRSHLWKAIMGFLIALVLSLGVGRQVLRFIAAPVETELQRYWDRYYKKKYEEVMAGLKDGTMEQGPPLATEILLNGDDLKRFFPEAKSGSAGDWVKVRAKITNTKEIGVTLQTMLPDIGKRPTLATMNVTEAFMVYLQVSIVTGLVLASPWVFYQIWSFIAAGLYPHEKRYVNVFLPVSLGLFLGGVFLCEFLVMPKAVGALLWFNEWLDLEPDLRLNEWLSFAILMPLVFGLAFQTPLVMLFLERIGVLTIDSFRSKRRIAWFVMAVFAAVFIPSPDALSMLFCLVPMCLLYELGILMCILAPKRPTFDFDETESEELIEV